MEVSEARAGLAVRVSRYIPTFFVLGAQRAMLANRRPSGSGVLVAPYPNRDGDIWYVRYPGNVMALHTLSELDNLSILPPRDMSTNRTWSRTPEQEEVRQRELNRERINAQLEQDRARAERLARLEREREEASEDERQGEIRRLELRLARSEEAVRETREALAALRERRRSRRVRPPAPPTEEPKPPEEDPIRFLDL